MDIENVLDQTVQEKENSFDVPWGHVEVLVGFIAVILLSVGMILIAYLQPDFANAVMMLYELAYLLPVALVLIFKKAKPNTLGLRSFKAEMLALGCGLLFIAYILIIGHNLLLMNFGIAPQADALAKLLESGEGFGMLAFAAVVLAPFVEEVFFRGFLFGGLRQKYGWKKAAFISATLFSIIHLQVVMLIPAFLMGYLFAYLYERSKSIYPSMILHFTVNAFTFSMIYLMSLLEPVA